MHQTDTGDLVFCKHEKKYVQLTSSIFHAGGDFCREQIQL